MHFRLRGLRQITNEDYRLGRGGRLQPGKALLTIGKGLSPMQCGLIANKIQEAFSKKFQGCRGWLITIGNNFDLGASPAISVKELQIIGFIERESERFGCLVGCACRYQSEDQSWQNDPGEAGQSPHMYPRSRRAMARSLKLSNVLDLWKWKTQ